MIHVLGDSHSLRFKGEEFRSLELPLATAYNMITPNSRSGARERAFQILDTIDRHEPVMFVLGEIDCRAHIMKHVTNDESMINNVHLCVDRYMQFLLEVKNKYNLTDLIVFGPIASTPWDLQDINRPTIGTQIERNKVTEEFNKYLRNKCQNNNLKFITLFYSMFKDWYSPNPDLYEDKVHMYPDKQTEMFWKEYNRIIK